MPFGPTSLPVFCGPLNRYRTLLQDLAQKFNADGYVMDSFDEIEWWFVGVMHREEGWS